MERRSFLLGLFALSSSAAGAPLVTGAEAASPAVAPAAPTPNPSAPMTGKSEAITLPDGLPLEHTQWRRRPRRRRRVCRIRRNRWGRRVRVCRTIWY